MEVLQKRETTRQRQQGNLPDNPGTVPAALSLSLRLLSHLQFNQHRVLLEVGPAIFARAAVSLGVFARRADESQRRMTANAELSRVRRFAPALGAFHHHIIAIGRFRHELEFGNPNREVVDAKGFEPSTSALRTPRSPN